MRSPAAPAWLRDVVVVLGTFAVLGVLGALIWWQVTPLAEFTRTATNAQMDEEQLGRQVASDGWYVVVAAVGGLVGGIGLVAWRKRDPLLIVVLVTLGALLASWLMLRLGLWLGPADPRSVLPDVAVGDTVPMRLETHAAGVPFVWPVAALIGAVGVLWGLDGREERREVTPAVPPDSPSAFPDDPEISATRSG